MNMYATWDTSMKRKLLASAFISSTQYEAKPFDKTCTHIIKFQGNFKTFYWRELNFIITIMHFWMIKETFLPAKKTQSPSASWSRVAISDCVMRASFTRFYGKAQRVPPVCVGRETCADRCIEIGAAHAPILWIPGPYMDSRPPRARSREQRTLLTLITRKFSPQAKQGALNQNSWSPQCCALL